MCADSYDYFARPFTALAHRGGWADEASKPFENSLRAFARAVELGYTHLETDVHTTADGVLIAFHDPRLERVTDAHGAVADLPWMAVRQARIGGTDPIPTLDDLLDALPTARFNIDLKAPGTVEALVDALDRHSAHDRVCVGSFSAPTIRRFRRRVTRPVATALDPVGVASFAFAPALACRSHVPGQALQIPVRDEKTRLPLVKPSLIRAAHAAGKVVHVWTINDVDEMHRLIDLGVDGLVSDDVRALKQVVLERGLEGPWS